MFEATGEERALTVRKLAKLAGRFVGVTRIQCAMSHHHSEVESLCTVAVIESVDTLLLFIPLPVEKLILKRVLLLYNLCQSGAVAIGGKRFSQLGGASVAMLFGAAPV